MRKLFTVVTLAAALAGGTATAAHAGNDWTRTDSSASIQAGSAWK